MKYHPDWDDRCSEVLRRNAHAYTNNEIAALIEGETGKRFSVSVVSRRRAALGLDSTHRNDWSAPIKRWQATRQRPGYADTHRSIGTMARRSQPTDRKAPVNELAAAFCLPLRGPGVFPRPGTLHFLDRRWLDAARPRTTSADPGAPLIMGVAVARDIDDQTVIRFRRGLDAGSIPAAKFYHANPVQTARRVMEQVVLHTPAAVFIDSTGSGCAVHARLAQLGCPHLVGVDVYARSADTGGDARYHDKRAAMWGSMNEWIKAGCLPDDPDLAAALASVEYAYDGNDAIQLERQYDVKRRGLPSPDEAEALALTFAYPV